MKNKTININGRILRFEKPIVMGILNATPDSFYSLPESGKTKTLIDLADSMVTEGAAILDIGGMSTKPGADLLSLEAEWERISEPIKNIRRIFPEVILSVDTFRAEIARRSAVEGIDLVNDISAGELDNQMLPAIATLKIPYIAMHIQGTPQTMQNTPSYEHVTRDILDFFIQKTEQLESLGIKDIIIDPGFGFGKTIAQNYQLLNELNAFSILDKPLLAGLSRKSMIYKLLHIQPSEALNATTALNMMALQNGADILRVHDVKEAMECIRLYEYAKNI